MHMCVWVTLSLGTHTTLTIQGFSCLYDHGVFTPINLLNQGWHSASSRNTTMFSILPLLQDGCSASYRCLMIAVRHLITAWWWLFRSLSLPDGGRSASYHCLKMAVQHLIAAWRWLFSFLPMPDDGCSASYRCLTMAVQLLIAAWWWLFSFLSLPDDGCSVLITAL